MMFERTDSAAYHSFGHIALVREDFHILREKLRIPKTGGLIERPRLDAILRKSRDQFPATLVSGRSGTGKTALAALFAAGQKNVAWYSVETTDIEWPVFSKYFSASLGANDLNSAAKHVSQNEIARFMVKLFSSADAVPTGDRSLIVLDDIHHIFDAPWFGDFFNLLLYSLPPETHLLLLCRSRPPNPLWRLRSKQMLNVIDEKVIAFTSAETEALFKGMGLTAAGAGDAHRDSFGRVSKLMEFAKD